MSLEVIGRSTLLAAQETKRALVLAAIPGLQDAEPRIAISCITLEFPAPLGVTVILSTVLALLILPRREVCPAQAVKHTTPIEATSAIRTGAPSRTVAVLQTADQMDTTACRPRPRALARI